MLDLAFERRDTSRLGCQLVLRRELSGLRVELPVGANNLFDEYPDAIAASTVNPVYALTNSLADGQIYPRSGGPFGMNGGFYYTRLRVAF